MKKQILLITSITLSLCADMLYLSGGESYSGTFLNEEDLLFRKIKKVEFSLNGGITLFSINDVDSIKTSYSRFDFKDGILVDEKARYQENIFNTAIPDKNIYTSYKDMMYLQSDSKLKERTTFTEDVSLVSLSNIDNIYFTLQKHEEGVYKNLKSSELEDVFAISHNKKMYIKHKDHFCELHPFDSSGFWFYGVGMTYDYYSHPNIPDASNMGPKRFVDKRYKEKLYIIPQYQTKPQIITKKFLLKFLAEKSPVLHAEYKGLSKRWRDISMDKYFLLYLETTGQKDLTQ